MLPESITAQELKMWFDQSREFDLFDVRESWEQEICLITGSYCISLGDLADRIDEVDRNKIAVFVCHHGGRSARAIGWLKNNGYEKLVNLEGGIEDWAVHVDNSIARY